jgi:hypothetical protein
MQVKILELRDAGTFIPIVAIDMNPENESQRWLLWRRGYPCDGVPNIAIFHANANGDPVWNDPYGWGGGARTYPVAHDWIIKNWHELADGDVVDVEWILHETEEPKVSERVSEGEWTVRPAPHITGDPEPEDL